ncbi:MAG: hypothetical protein IJY87_01750 [Bacilli bacterium]|nr:hypothetical protein [Bacilli bacterium]
MEKKRFNVKIIEMKITDFNLYARNKKVVTQTIEELIHGSNILNLPDVEHSYETTYTVKRIKNPKTEGEKD